MNVKNAELNGRVKCLNKINILIKRKKADKSTRVNRIVILFIPISERVLTKIPQVPQKIPERAGAAIISFFMAGFLFKCVKCLNKINILICKIKWSLGYFLIRLGWRIYLRNEEFKLSHNYLGASIEENGIKYSIDFTMKETKKDES